MHRAPMVERGETSTRCEPTLMEKAIDFGSAPKRSARLGTVGRNAGNTTPEVLLYVEMSPVTKAIMAVTVALVANFANNSVKSDSTPVRSRSEIGRVTPVTIKMTFHGALRIASPRSADRVRPKIIAATNAAIPTLILKKTTPAMSARIDARVIQFSR